MTNALWHFVQVESVRELDGIETAFLWPWDLTGK